MKSLRILVLHPSNPDTISVTTLFFKNLLPVLKKKFNVHLIWIIHKPQKLEQSFIETSKETILDIHSFENAVEILNNTKPDLVYLNVNPNFLHYAFSKAAKKQNIPVLSGIFTKAPNLKRSKQISSFVKLFFHANRLTKKGSNEKQVIHRSHLIFRLKFLLTTLKIINQNSLKSLKEIFFDIFSEFFFITL